MRRRVGSKPDPPQRELIMTDENQTIPFYAPNRPPAPPRQPKPGEHLWTLTKGAQSRRAELRDHGEIGAELQIYTNADFLKGQRYESRALAMLKADAIRDALRAGGWT